VTKSHLGHGLGASIIKAIVDLLNGSITVSSTKDAGSLFTVLIPEAEGGPEVNMYSGDSNEFFFEAEEEQQF
jgi:signal transduction histidine kinase